LKRFGYLSVVIAFALWAFGFSQALAQGTILPPGETCFSALAPTSGGPGGTGTGFVGLLGTITAGTGGTTGTYGGVLLTGGHGTGATANITVSGGGVTAVAILSPGVSYVAGDVLSAASGNIGNVSGFSVPVSSVAINQSLAGGTVAFYVPNTSTFKQTWFNADLGSNHQNTNPVTLDANGCAIIYGSGIYRQVLEDSLGNIIWDQLTASTNQNNPYWANLAGGTPNAITVTDTAFAAIDGQIIGFIPLYTNTGATTLDPSGYGVYPIVKDTSTGAVALTGGEIVANSPSNVVYVSFSASQQNFHIINLVQTAGSVASSVSITPQGYLNLVGVASGGPIQGASDVTGAQTVYYSPYVGNQVPVWNGSSFTILPFAELQIALSSAQSASTIYDVCIFNNAGTAVGVFGPAWSSSVAGSSTRGTGAGSAQIQYQNGVLVNSFAINANNGSNPYTIPALECTYVGSIYVDATQGQVSNYRTWGQSRKWGIWNPYNCVPIYLQAGDSTSSWSYTTNKTLQPANNNTANSLTVFSGLPSQIYDLEETQLVGVSASEADNFQIGIGYNVTNAASGFSPTLLSPAVTASGGTENALAIYLAPPSLGINTVTALEAASFGGGTLTFHGTIANMLLSAKWCG
jgi:hypothetical protein